MSDEVDSDVTPRRECFLEEFKEFVEILQIIRNVKNIVQNQVSLERSLEKFSCKFGFRIFQNMSEKYCADFKFYLVFVDIINQYQEQPHLLDPHLSTNIFYFIYLDPCMHKLILKQKLFWMSFFNQSKAIWITSLWYTLPQNFFTSCLRCRLTCLIDVFQVLLPCIFFLNFVIL